MRHQKTRHKLSRTSAHRKALLRNLCKEVIEHERIKTTEAKAKAVKPEVEQLITLAKRGDLHARRQALSALGQDKFAVHKLFEEVAPRYAERPGGYTRILKLGPRRSDSTEMVFLELRLRPAGPRCRGVDRAPAAVASASTSSTTARTSPAGRGSPAGARSRTSSRRRWRRCCREPRRADGRRADRRGRPCDGPGRLVRGRAGAARGPQRAAAAPTSPCSACARGGGRLRRAPRRDARARYRYRVLASRTRSAFERGRALWWPHALDRALLDALRGAARRDARLHRLHADRDRPRALRARRARRAAGREQATLLSVLDRGRHVHAPHEPRARRDDARGRRRTALARVVRGAAATAPTAATRGRPRRRTGSTSSASATATLRHLTTIAPRKTRRRTSASASNGSADMSPVPCARRP